LKKLNFKDPLWEGGRGGFLKGRGEEVRERFVVKNIKEKS
jgi:hypothetical protein